jgi:NTP pyrophosphatase (non-canonical NTP hydrolase)
MKLNELRDKIHENAKAKGFYEDEMKIRKEYGLSKKDIVNLEHAFFTQRIAIIHSELSEALEADRNNHYSSAYDGCFDENGQFDKNYFERWIKSSLQDEFADVIIRTLDLCGYLEIDIEKHVELKMRYNETREYKHCKNY